MCGNVMLLSNTKFYSLSAFLKESVLDNCKLTKLLSQRGKPSLRSQHSVSREALATLYVLLLQSSTEAALTGNVRNIQRAGLKPYPSYKLAGIFLPYL